MATVRDTVERALRLIRITDQDETPTADEANNALIAFNDMLHGWKLIGIDLLYTDKTLNDPFPLGPEFREGTAHVLASRISPNYAAPVAFDAAEFMRQVQAAHVIPEEAMIDPALTWQGSTRYRSYL